MVKNRHAQMIVTSMVLKMKKTKQLFWKISDQIWASVLLWNWTYNRTLHHISVSIAKSWVMGEIGLQECFWALPEKKVQSRNEKYCWRKTVYNYLR